MPLPNIKRIENLKGEDEGVSIQWWARVCSFGMAMYFDKHYIKKSVV